MPVNVKLHAKGYNMKLILSYWGREELVSECFPIGKDRRILNIFLPRYILKSVTIDNIDYVTGIGNEVT